MMYTAIPSTFDNVMVREPDAYPTALFFQNLSHSIASTMRRTFFPLSSKLELHFGLRGAFMIPHPEKAHRGGEDSFFLNESALCVADGVGGWASEGVDPAIYTRRVVSAAHAQILATAPKPPTALAIIEEGVSKAQGLKGSCTIIGVTISGGESANVHLVGDCGLMQVRDGSVVFRTKEQQQGFNCPYQIPSFPARMGLTSTVDVVAGDVFILGSDGLFDNVFDKDLLKVVVDGNIKAAGSFFTTAELCQSIAENLCELAFKQSNMKSFESPFAKAAKAQGYRFQGGKPDDITAVVGIVTPTSENHAPAYSGIEDVIFVKGRSQPKKK